MDRRIAIIRCALFTALGAAFFGVGWFYAGAGFTALGLMMPVFATATCGPCGSSNSAQVQVEVAGIVNNGNCTTCADYNQAFVLSNPTVTLGAGCEYDGELVACPSYRTNEKMFWLWEDSPAATHRAEFSSDENVGPRYIGGAGATSVDCSVSEGALTFDSAGGWGGFTGFCNFNSSSATQTVL
jgi:hypothetical protein